MNHFLNRFGIDNHWHQLSLVALPLLIYLKNPALALIIAMMASLLAGKKMGGWANKLSKSALQCAIVLLGFTLNLQDLWAISRDYSALVSTYVILTLALGLVLGLLLRVDPVTRQLTSGGTAICGGTTVASLSPILKASVNQTGVVMAMIFLLNAVAMLSYPLIGRWLGLEQHIFGLWAALSIHDTSSVVATAALYGEEALQVATTVKLGRTLWLIPLLVVFSVLTKQDSAKIRLPLFVLFFVGASMAGSLLQLDQELIVGFTWLSKALLVVALFFIGSQIDMTTLKQMRGRALVHALLLWAIVAPATLMMILWVS